MPGYPPTDSPEHHRPPPPSAEVDADDMIQLAILPLEPVYSRHSRDSADKVLASPGLGQAKGDDGLFDAERGLHSGIEGTQHGVGRGARGLGGLGGRMRGWGAKGSDRSSLSSGRGSSPSSPSAPPDDVRVVPVGLWQSRFNSLLTRLSSSHPRAVKTLLWLRGPSPTWIETTFPPFPLPFVGHRLARLEVWCTARVAPLQRQRQFTTPIFLLAWLLGLTFLARKSFFTSSTAVGAPTWIDSTTTFWSRNDGCGLNGTACEPFSDSSLVFRCPAATLSAKLLNQRAVGPLEVIYQPLVVGGFDTQATYRADSWVCAAAIQQGLFGNARGGCGQVEMVGEFAGFAGGERNGVESVGFDSTFPSSFRFVEGVNQEGCQDLRDDILGFDVAMSAVFSFFVRPAPQAFFWALFCFGYWHVVLASDPSAMPPDISAGFKSFLPALFVGESFWRHAWRWTLPAFEPSGYIIERTVWYLAGFWVGVLSNLTFEKIPIDRLTPHDINQQPGGLIAVIILAIFLFGVVVNQLRVIRRTGYAVGGIVVAILASLPDLSFRLHHYIAAICLIPGTAFVTRPSAIFQGFLTGLFLNGIARWGFDSILETPASLIGDGALGTSLPVFLTNSSNFAASLADGLVSWTSIEQAGTQTEGWDGFALLVDDVLRQTGSATNFSLMGLDASIPHYFRLAYQSGGVSGDFTKAAIAFLSNSTWIDPASGPS
ncbi:hypothetical protein JCM10213v2_001707 [Rhodosporidiobolus nylandii]